MKDVVSIKEFLSNSTSESVVDYATEKKNKYK